jgi:hypothetical protein
MVAGQSGLGWFHRKGSTVFRHFAPGVQLEDRDVGFRDVFETTTACVTGKAKSVVPIGSVRKNVAADSK